LVLHRATGETLMAARIVPEGGWQSRLKPFKTPRKLAPKHLSFVKQLPCICCLVEGREIQSDDPMHVRSASAFHGKETGGAEKPDDRWSLPGCRPHHDLQHGGNELAFWRAFGVDPFVLSLALWGVTGDDHAARQLLREHAVMGVGKRFLGEAVERGFAAG
jgi:hypothetical protein